MRFVHRDWNSSDAVLVRMFNSHIDILSPGELLRPLKISDIAKDDYIPMSRNKTIVEVLSKSDVMDKRGTGFLRIRRALDKYNMPHPECMEKHGYFVIKFVNPAITKVPIVDDSMLNDRQKKAIEYLKEKGRITTKEYIDLVKTSLITAKRDLLHLKDKRLIKFIGAPKTGYYCLNGTVNGTVNDTVNDTVK